MNITSARDLKEKLTRDIIAQLSPVQKRSLGFAPRPKQPLQPAGTLALGIARAHARDYKLAVRVQRQDLMHSDYVDRILREAHGEVDVRFVGDLTKRSLPWHQQRQRPLRVGCSVAHHESTAGTLGCFVRKRSVAAADAQNAGSPVLLLSNNHVLANENEGKPGDKVLQPGPADSGALEEDFVAVLRDFTTLKKKEPNVVDCAVAELRSGIAYSNEIANLGRLAGLGEEVLEDGAAVIKVGRTTGLRRGRISAFEVTNVHVEFDLGILRFDNQIEIEAEGDEAFCSDGDSGSLIVDEQLRAVGLIFAGSDLGGQNDLGLTYANPIRTVLDALRVDLLY